MITITKIKRFLSALGISLIAFFELCFTGKARNAWRIARVDAGRSNNLETGAVVSFSPPSAPIYLTRVIIILLAIALMIVGALLCAERSTGNPFHLEDAHRTIELQQRAPTEGTSSIMPQKTEIRSQKTEVGDQNEN